MLLRTTAPASSCRSSARLVRPLGLGLASVLVLGLGLTACDDASGRDGLSGELGPDGKFDTDGDGSEVVEPICGRFDELYCAAGEDACVWDWRNVPIAEDCSAVKVAGGYVTSSDPGLAELLETVARPGDVDGLKRKCVLVEEVRQLCAQGRYVPNLRVGVELADQSWVEPTLANQTRTSSCHPGAEYACDPLDPSGADPRDRSYEEIRALSRTDLDDAQLVPAPQSYCSGEVAGDRGYATTIPSEAAFGTVTSWSCSDVESTEAFVQERLEPFDGVLLGMPASTVMSFECPIRKALVDCVAPNLGEPTACTLGSDPGTSYASLSGDYCYRMVQGRKTNPDGTACTGTAHCEGTGLDFNNNVLGHLNGGNISGCIEQNAGPSCTEGFRSPLIDLPPQFVAVMEGCGFQWLGRTGADASSPVSEGGRFGCDPMHFELILPL